MSQYQRPLHRLWYLTALIPIAITLVLGVAIGERDSRSLLPLLVIPLGPLGAGWIARTIRRRRRSVWRASLI